jgi:hypothetical protein
VPLGKDNLTPAEVAQLTGPSVHTLGYWRQTGRGPKAIKAGTRTLYRRNDVAQWLAEVDGRSQPVRSRKNGRSESTSTTTGWYEKAVEAARRIEPAHTSPWKLASTYALLSIAESLLPRQPTRPPRLDPTGAPGQPTGTCGPPLSISFTLDNSTRRLVSGPTLKDAVETVDAQAGDDRPAFPHAARSESN